MYRSTEPRQLEFPDFYLPFSGHLDPDNRWIALAQLVPWELAEQIYHQELTRRQKDSVILRLVDACRRFVTEFVR